MSALDAVDPGSEQARRRSLNEAWRAFQQARTFLIQSLSPFTTTVPGSQEAKPDSGTLEERYRELIEQTKTAELALRDLEERSRTILETIEDGYFEVDLAGNMTFFNRSLARMLGYPEQELMGMNDREYTDPENAQKLYQTFNRVYKTGVPVKEFDFKFIRKDKTQRFAEISVSLFRDTGGRPAGFRGIVRDITDRKRAEEALHRLNQALEEEARRIAHALHDEGGQLLALVHIALEDMVRGLPPPANERLGKVKELLDQIEDGLRQLSHELRPTILDDLGLLPALEFLAEGVSKRTGLPVTVEGPMQGRLPPAIETCLYRVVQQALTNVTKHAHASHATVQVQKQHPLIRCSIRDDGVGFEVALMMAMPGERGLGLIGMRERVNLLGGALEIISAPGQGTELLITLPLAQ